MKDGELKMTISKEIEDLFKKEPFFLEIEMLQGNRKVLKNGMIKYSITISDPDKQIVIREFVLKIISQSHKQSKN